MARVKIVLGELPFTTEIPVRITDINYGGHLGNDALLAILHEARVRFLAGYGLTEKNAGGAGIIMVDAAIMYRSESFYGDVLLVEVGIGEMQRTGCDILYRVLSKDGGREIARAKTGIAFFDYAKRKVVEAPARFRELLG